MYSILNKCTTQPIQIIMTYERSNTHVHVLIRNTKYISGESRVFSLGRVDNILLIVYTVKDKLSTSHTHDYGPRVRQVVQVEAPTLEGDCTGGRGVGSRFRRCAQLISVVTCAQHTNSSHTFEILILLTLSKFLVLKILTSIITERKYRAKL